MLVTVLAFNTPQGVQQVKQGAETGNQGDQFKDRHQCSPPKGRCQCGAGGRKGAMLTAGLGRKGSVK